MVNEDEEEVPDKGVDAAMEFVHKDVVPNLQDILGINVCRSFKVRTWQ